MALLDRLKDKDAAQRHLASLGEAESLTVVEALLMTLHADGEVTEEEQRLFRAELAELPWGFTQDRAALERAVEQARLRVQADRHLSPDEFARKIASRLPDQVVRERLLAMAVALIYADGLEAFELTFVGALARAFDVSEEQLAELVALHIDR